MTPFTASIETYEHGTFQHGYHLGTDERVARACCEDLMHLERGRGPGYYPIRVRTVGLMRDGQLLDVFDGDWSSAMLDAMYDEYLDGLDRSEPRYHGA